MTYALFLTAGHLNIGCWTRFYPKIRYGFGSAFVKAPWRISGTEREKLWLNRDIFFPRSIFRRSVFPAIHPGEILRAEFMEPLRLSMNRLALGRSGARSCVPVTRIAEIVHERRGITPDGALRLARYFNTSAGFWMNLQTAYDLEVAADKLLPTIEREVRPVAVVASSAVSG